MDLEYETSRLKLKILKGNGFNVRQVLDFFIANRGYFEPYEPTRSHNFYTENYQKTVLNYEYNLAVKLSTVRFWVYQKNNPNQIVGTICFHDIMQSVYQSCSVGYKFHHQFWHQGYAAEAMELGIQIMFEDLGLHRIEAFVMPTNLPSVHLLERLHFQYEGICRQSILICDQWEDHLQYACLK